MAAPWRAAATAPSVLAAFPELARVLERSQADWLVVEPTAIAIGWEAVVADAGLLDLAIGAVARWAEGAAAGTGPYR